MRFFVEIECDNAAFAAPGGETSRTFRNRETLRIFRHVDDALQRGQESGVLLDRNGNTVGSYGFARDDEPVEPRAHVEEWALDEPDVQDVPDVPDVGDYGIR